MKRYKEGKGRHGGTAMLSGEFVRNVDQWQAFASIPFLDTHIEDHGDAPDVHYTLIEDGQQIAAWREADMPGFAGWLGERVAQYHGAWHVARKALKLTTGQRRTANAQAMARRQEAARRDEKILSAARSVMRAEGRIKIAGLAATLHDRGMGGRCALEKKLSRLLKKSREGR